MPELYGCVETGGTWCVCALGRGPDELVNLEQFPTADPEGTLERIVGFFNRHPRPTAVGVGSFGPRRPESRLVQLGQRDLDSQAGVA
jgi:fructokinase